MLDTLFDKARPRFKRRVVLRPVRHSVAFEAALLTNARKMLRGIGQIARADLLPAAISGRQALISDDTGRVKAVIETIRGFVEGFTAGAVEVIAMVFGRERDRFEARFGEQVKSIAGIDLGLAIRSRGQEEKLRLAGARYASLVRGLGDEAARRLETLIYAKMTAGASNADIAEALVKEFGFLDRRAKIIARDQAAKFNGSLNKDTQTRVGVTTYIWSTSLDERVRGNPDGSYPSAKPSHWHREGKEYRWDNPPADGHPGEPILCRCTAKAVLEF